MKQTFCYSFRFCCDPYANQERELDALKVFARQAQVDDVAVFCNVEELNTGHMREQEQVVFLQLLDAVKSAVAEQGISVSVNHWHSLMHADLGKQLPPDQPFRPMVDVDGREAALCVCPLCSAWQDYFCRMYAAYAAKKPHILWVEDDFRLHNHAPLRWGGCFCEAHMAEYSRRAGKKLTRDAFLKGVLAAGEPHPYRKIWLDVNRETMCALAKKVSDAVHAVSPETKIGLMSSVPYVHSAEGRDWHGLLNAFAGPNLPVSRIHLPCYSEIAPRDYLLRFNMISMANRALIPENTEVYPELENYPYSLFSKSRAFTRFQMLSAMPLNLRGMTIDLFDLNGSGIVLEDGYQDMLRELKPFLNRLTDEQVFCAEQQGVCVMLCETSSYTVHTDGSGRMESLYPQEVYYAGVLSAMGISYRFCTDPSVKGQLCAVSGQYFRNLSETQIRALIAENRLILSGDAVDTLVEMGLGSLIGVKCVRWMQLNGGEYTYEEVSTDDRFGGLPHARASAVISSADVLKIEYSGAVQQLTAFYNSFRRQTSIGHVIVDRNLFVDPFGHFPEPSEVPPMQLNTVRRDLFQYAVSALQPEVTMICGAAWLAPYVLRQKETLQIYLVNGSLDAAPQILIKTAFVPKCVKICDSRNQRRLAAFAYTDGMLQIRESLAPLDACLITLEP